MVEISLCMIVKNEEANLDASLSSIASHVDEIVIVDTGSTDNTKEIAKRYTDKVYDYTWENDFSMARNFSISKAEKEFILVLDADEVVEHIDMKGIKQLAYENKGRIGRLLRKNEYTRNNNSYVYQERVNRLFPKALYRYEGMIHEQLILNTGEIAETYLLPLAVKHHGYEGDITVRRNKTERNIKLLEAALKQNSSDPYLHYQLGKSYYMAEDYMEASRCFDRAICFDLDPRLEYVQDLVETYGYSLLNSGQYEKALQLLNIYDDFAHSADFVYLIAFILMNNQYFDQAIREFLKATGYKESKMEGVNSYLAYYNAGVISECLGDVDNALKYYRRSGNYPPAVKAAKALSP